MLWIVLADKPGAGALHHAGGSNSRVRRVPLRTGLTGDIQVEVRIVIGSRTARRIDEDLEPIDLVERRLEVFDGRTAIVPRRWNRYSDDRQLWEAISLPSGTYTLNAFRCCNGETDDGPSSLDFLVGSGFVLLLLGLATIALRIVAALSGRTSSFPEWSSWLAAIIGYAFVRHFVRHRVMGQRTSPPDLLVIWSLSDLDDGKSDSSG